MQKNKFYIGDTVTILYRAGKDLVKTEIATPFAEDLIVNSKTMKKSGRKDFPYFIDNEYYLPEFD